MSSDHRNRLLSRYSDFWSGWLPPAIAVRQASYEERAAICRARAAGATWEAIAAKLGMTRANVRSLAGVTGPDAAGRPRSKRAPAHVWANSAADAFNLFQQQTQRSGAFRFLHWQGVTFRDAQRAALMLPLDCSVRRMLLQMTAMDTGRAPAAEIEERGA